MPNLKLLKSVKAAYSDDFMGDICKRIQISDDAEEQNFREALPWISAGYLDLLANNQGRLTPGKQSKLLKNYAASLQKTKELG